MHIVIATCGSRGDQQPILSLAHCLSQRGHRVTIGAPRELEGPASRLGVSFAETSLSMQPLLQVPGTVTGKPSDAQLTQVRSFLRENLELQLRTLSELSADADVLLGTTLIQGGSSVAAAFTRPYVRVHFSPNTFPSGSYSPPGSPPEEDLDARERSWARYGSRFDEVLLPSLNQYRREHGLHEAEGVLSVASTEYVLLACDLALAPAPERTTPLTPRHITQTGAWQRSQGGSLESPLLRWLTGLACAPLYAGLGSVPSANWPAFVRSLLVSCYALGRPVVLCGADPGGANGLRSALGEAVAEWSTEHVQFVQEVPHAQLFPRCWAVLHHGGAGTVASAARAGVPQVVIPQARGSDQRTWLHRVEQLGIGVGARSDGCADEAELRRLLAQLDREHPSIAARAESVRHALQVADARSPPEEMATDAIEAIVARAERARGAQGASRACR